MADKSKESRFSGFVNENNGIITESFSRFKAIKGKQTSGFCYKNSEEIRTCYSLIDYKKCNSKSGFVTEDHGAIYDSFYTWKANKKNRNSKEMEEHYLYIDYNSLEYGLAYQSMKSWDFINVWENGSQNEGPFVPQFQDRAFIEEGSPGKIEYIYTSEQLFELAKKVNSGGRIDPMLAYTLANDIDLKGKVWEPIGIDGDHPFSGIFDGNGFCIKNLVIQGKKHKYSGFFCYLKQAVIINLDLDLRIVKGNICGGLAAISNKSFISCCSVNASFHGCKNVGGFINVNYGEIKRCYCVSRMKKLYTPPYRFILFFFLLSLLLLFLYYYRNKIDYPKIPVDPNVVSVEADNGNKGNEVTIRMKTNIEIDEGIVALDFMNPGVSGKNIVVEIQISDQELKAVKGSTGRLVEDQEELEADENYSESSLRTTIAKSGLIESGAQLTTLDLIPFPDGSELPSGTYQGIAYFKFYSRSTNEKAILDSQMPVKIIVK